VLIDGKCHCGNIRFELEWPGEAGDMTARACGCSFCTKHAGVWTAHPQAGLSVYVADPALVSPYAFATRTAVFQVCARCGVVPLVISDIDAQRYAVVNVNAFEQLDPSRIVRAGASFDSEDAGARLERRQRNWIARVAFAPAATVYAGA